MRLLNKIFTGSPAVSRAAPFLIFLALTFCQGEFGEESRYWFYCAKTFVGAWLIWEMRPLVLEMRWAFSWEAVVVGISVFALWVGISGEWTTQSMLWVKLSLAHPSAEAPKLWNPLEQFGRGSPLVWVFIVTRILGSTFVVPPLEEVFYRSFMYRYIASQNFLSV